MTPLHTRAADMPTTEQLLRESNAYLTAVGHRRWCGTAGDDACECGITQLRRQITAYLAQQSALDELVRETERLGLYDEQRKAQEAAQSITAYIDAAAADYDDFDGMQVPYGARTMIADFAYGLAADARFIALLNAAPAPAQPRQPLSEERLLQIKWAHVNEPNERYPITDDDWVAFGRAIERAHGIGAITGDKP